MSIPKQSEELLKQFHKAQPPKPRRGIAAVDLEREACAKVAEELGYPGGCDGDTGEIERMTWILVTCVLALVVGWLAYVAKFSETPPVAPQWTPPPLPPPKLIDVDFIRLEDAFRHGTSLHIRTNHGDAQGLVTCISTAGDGDAGVRTLRVDFRCEQTK